MFDYIHVLRKASLVMLSVLDQAKHCSEHQKAQCQQKSWEVKIPNQLSRIHNHRNCFKHTITKPLCLSCRFAQIPAQFGSILCYLSCLFMFLLPCSIVSSAEFSVKLFFRRQNDDVGRRRSELRRLFRDITRLTRIFL